MMSFTPNCQLLWSYEKEKSVTPARTQILLTTPEIENSAPHLSDMALSMPILETQHHEGDLQHLTAHRQHVFDLLMAPGERMYVVSSVKSLDTTVTNSKKTKTHL